MLVKNNIVWLDVFINVHLLVYHIYMYIILCSWWITVKTVFFIGPLEGITNYFHWCAHSCSRDAVNIISPSPVLGGTLWLSWLRHCATSRKVEGSIHYGVTGSFHWHNTSGRTITLGLTQPLTEMSTGNIYWGVKTTGAYGWQPYHLHVPIV